MTDIVAITAAQFDAYNAQDLDAYCGYFTDDVIVADYNGAITRQGMDAYRAGYADTFGKFPQNKALLLNRMVVGDTVIDHEKVSRGPEGPEFEVAAIYTFRGDKICRIDFIR